MTVTFAARGPFGLSTTSKRTRSPSFRVRKPSARISLWWTKTSGPPSRERKPKPLDSLNHLTVPLIMNVQASFGLCSSPRPLHAHKEKATHRGRLSECTSKQRRLARHLLYSALRGLVKDYLAKPG